MAKWYCSLNWTVRVKAENEKEARKKAYAILRSRIELKKVNIKDFTCRLE